MKNKYYLYLLLSLLVFTSCSSIKEKSASDRESILETNRLVRQAFINQDINEILKFHHTDVQKVLSWDNYQIGHEAMKAGLGDLFKAHQVEFLGDVTEMDSLEFIGDTAVMIAKFKIKGIPKKPEFSSFIFEGRTMIVYVRSKNSPTGWVTYREMIIPAANK